MIRIFEACPGSMSIFGFHSQRIIVETIYLIHYELTLNQLDLMLTGISLYFYHRLKRNRRISNLLPQNKLLSLPHIDQFEQNYAQERKNCRSLMEDHTHRRKQTGCLKLNFRSELHFVRYRIFVSQPMNLNTSWLHTWRIDVQVLILVSTVML